MNLKKLALALSLTAAFTYMGCDDSSTAPATGGDDQPTLSSASTGDEGGEPAASSASTGDEGGEPSATSSEAKAESTDSGDVPPASSADSGTIPRFDSTFTFDSTAYASAMKCDEEGATQEQYGMTMTCKDGQWAVDSSAIAELMKCEAGETMEQMGMVMTCKDGQWAYDSTATAAANKCDEEGATKTETMSMMGSDIEMKYTLRMNRGAVVNTIDRKFVRDIFEMRRLLESEAVARAAGTWAIVPLSVVATLAVVTSAEAVSAVVPAMSLLRLQKNNLS